MEINAQRLEPRGGPDSLKPLQLNIGWQAMLRCATSRARLPVRDGVHLGNASTRHLLKNLQGLANLRLRSLDLDHLGRRHLVG